MSKNLHNQIFSSLNLKETDELVDIWITNDRVEWSDIAFDVVQEILEQRLDELPAQNAPVFEHKKQEDEKIVEEEIDISKHVDPDNLPVFYNPSTTIRMNKLLNRAAIPAVIITAIISIPSLLQMQSILSSYFWNNPNWRFMSWLLALIIGGLLIAFQCFIVYFSLKALASILRILMEMEFNSRATK